METPESPILSRLRPPNGAVRRKKRVGRGPGSGWGKTSGRGQKGQKARKPGNLKKLHFEGGQMPLQRRVPKRGFYNLFSTPVAEVNVGSLERFNAGDVIDTALLISRRLVRPRASVVKVLGAGELTKPLVVHAHRFSDGARSKIEAVGGRCEILVGESSSASNAPAEAVRKLS